MKISKIVWLLFSFLMISACTWVNVKPEAEKVRVASSEQVLNCKKVGSTTVSVKAEVATFARDPKKVRQELATLARNSAPDLKGNVVVPVSKVDKGKQNFVIYNCP